MNDTGNNDQIELRNQLYETYLDSKSDESFILSTKQRNLVNKLKRKAMSDCYENKLGDSKGNLKETWNILNEIMG